MHYVLHTASEQTTRAQCEHAPRQGRDEQHTSVAGCSRGDELAGAAARHVARKGHLATAAATATALERREVTPPKVARTAPRR